MAYPSRLQQLLDEGRISIRSGLKFEFGTGTYRICSGKSPIIALGEEYLPNAILEVEISPKTLGTAATPLKIKLPAQLDFGLTPDKLKTIEQEDYKNRPVTFYDFYFDPDSNAFLYAEPREAGYVDTIDHVETDSSFYLQANVETSALDNFRLGYRTASDEDQQEVSAGDRFFQHSSTVKHKYFDIKL